VNAANIQIAKSLAKDRGLGYSRRNDERQRAEVRVTQAQEITMKRTNPFIIPLTMLLVCIALDSFAGSATLSKPRKAAIAQKELPDKPWQEWSWTWQPWKLVMWSYMPGNP